MWIDEKLFWKISEETSTEFEYCTNNGKYKSSMLVTPDTLLSMVEELLYKIDHLNEQIEDLNNGHDDDYDAYLEEKWEDHKLGLI